MTDINDNSIANIDEISNVADFVQHILKYRKKFDYKEDYKEDYIHFFRGHTDENYELKPSLFRNDRLLQKEDVMFREIIASNPSDFAEDHSTYDKLVRMQHYGLPTRLLDITTNPLMALYFASIKNKKKANINNGECEEICNENCNKKCDKVETNGDVIIISVHRDAIKFFDCDTTSVIANLARMDKDAKDKVKKHAEKATKEHNSVKYFNNDKEINKENEVHRLIHFINDEKPFFQPIINPKDIDRIICVKSKMSNLRISSQAGAFLLFGHDAVLNKEYGNGKEWFIIKSFRISGENKESIRKDLDQLDINESTVFAHLDNSARYIKEKYTNTKGASGK